MSLKPGSIRRVDWTKPVSILSRLPIFYEDGQLKTPYTSNVWQRAYDLSGRQIQSVSLYLDVRHNRKGILDTLREAHCVSTNHPIDKSPETGYLSSNEEDKEKVQLSPKNDSKLVQIYFNITLSKKEWFSIRAISKRYKDNKVYKVLKPGWTHLISKKIRLSDFKLPCAFRFRKHQFLRGSEFYFFGHCKEKRIDYECKNKIWGQFVKFSKGNVVVNITSGDTRGVKHLQKRPLSNKRRLSAQKKMQHVGAARFRIQKSNKMMKYGEPEPPDLNTSKVIQL